MFLALRFFTNDIIFIFILFHIYFRLGKLLLEFKMGCKAGETTLKINNAFSLGTANEHTGQWWFKKFCKKDKSLEDKELSGWPSEVTTTY